MSLQRAGILFVVALVLVVFEAGAGDGTVAEAGRADDEQRDAAPVEGGPDVERLLRRLERLARLFRDSALRFSCEETITWSDAEGSGRRKFGYVYVTDERLGLRDYRTFVGPGRGARPREVSPAAQGVPSYVLNANLWVFTFQKSRRYRHRFSLAGEREVLGRPAVGVRFEPIPPIVPRVNDWYGTAWVDGETTQLLRVEAMRPRDHDERRALLAHLDGARADREYYDIETVTTVYSVVEKGMRFPGKATIDRVRHRPYERRGVWHDDVRTLRKVRQTYRHYEFFGVRTTDEVFAFIEGEVD